MGESWGESRLSILFPSLTHQAFTFALPNATPFDQKANRLLRTPTLLRRYARQDARPKLGSARREPRLTSRPQDRIHTENTPMTHTTSDTLLPSAESRPVLERMQG